MSRASQLHATAIESGCRLADDPVTLEELSSEFDISRERVRQIEVRAFEKVQEAVQKDALERAKALRVVEA